jgi:hypothetical protein
MADDEDRDTQRANELCEAEARACNAASNRLREAVQNGDIDAMRAAFGGMNGLLIGTGVSHFGGESSEQIVLTEVLNNSNLSLEILNVFFRELKGRFMVDVQHSVCVFSMLIHIECSTNFEQDAEVGRWTLRVAEVVRYLVNELKMPIHANKLYRPRAMMSFCLPLMDLAMDFNACACIHAFGQFMRINVFGHFTPNSIALYLLEEVLDAHRSNAHSRFWIKRLATAAEDDDALWHLSRRTKFLAEHTALLNDEVVARRQHKQVLLLLQNRVPGNAWACAVMDDSELSHMIMKQAFSNASS